MREEGYYWVFFSSQDGWMIGEWWGDHWTVTGSSNEFKDSDFEKIGPKIITYDD